MWEAKSLRFWQCWAMRMLVTTGVALISQLGLHLVCADFSPTLRIGRPFDPAELLVCRGDDKRAKSEVNDTRLLSLVSLALTHSCAM